MRSDGIILQLRTEFVADLFINGCYVQPRGGARFDDIEPSSGELLARVASADEGDIESLVAVVRQVAGSDIAAVSIERLRDESIAACQVQESRIRRGQGWRCA